MTRHELTPVQSTFLKESLFTLPRLLSLVNQNEASSLYGCLDRTFWNYKMIDFPCGRMQESCLSFALLAKDRFGGRNPYFGNSKLMKIAKGSTLFLARIQHSDGTFDQFWPNEVSSAGSAFPAYCLAASYELLEDEFSSDEQSLIVEALTRSLKLCGSLAETDYGVKGALNQEIGTICALSKISQVLHLTETQSLIRRRLAAFLSFQSSEGWFPEFQGADAGYSFVTLDYLMKTYEIEGIESIIEAGRKMVEFLSYLIHPNGTVGGEYASRNTEWIAPHGLALLSQHSPIAQSILHCISKGLEEGSIVGLRYMDDRYLTYEHYTFLQAALVEDNPSEETPRLPFEYEQKTEFKKAGIVSITKGDYYILFSPRKGGNFRIYNMQTGNLAANDTGLVILNQSGGLYLSGWLQDSPNIEYSIRESDETLILESKTNLKRYSDTVPNSLFMILSRIGLSAIALSFGLRRKLLETLRNLLITKTPRVVGHLHRTIILEKSSLSVEDHVRLKEQPRSLVFANKTTDRYITSKQFGQFQDISSIEPASVHVHRRDGGFIAIREYDLKRLPSTPKWEVEYVIGDEHIG